MDGSNLVVFVTYSDGSTCHVGTGANGTIGWALVKALSDDYWAPGACVNIADERDVIVTSDADGVETIKMKGA